MVASCTNKLISENKWHVSNEHLVYFIYYIYIGDYIVQCYIYIYMGDYMY